VSPEKKNLHTMDESVAKDQSSPKKTYRPPTFSVYGRIERMTGGGSGMSKESLAMESFRHP
jgi:hypothetical protein